MDNKEYSKKERDSRSKLHRIKKSTNFNTHPNTRWKFDYNNNTWSCPLQTMRCAHEIKTNIRCKRNTTYTTVYCWQHLKSVAKLRIGTTTMQDSKRQKLDFTGLFVCDMKKFQNTIIFKTGDIITSYIGEIISNAELQNRYPGKETAPYTLQISKTRFLDSACIRSVGSLANACLPTNKNCKLNAKLVIGSHGNYPHLKASKNIRNGDEIFISYGRTYFNKTSVHRDFVTKPNQEYKSKNYEC